MAYYRQVGEVPRKRHTQFRQPDGGLYAEELMGVEGFSSRLVAALPPPPADGDRVERGLRRRRRSQRRPNHPLKPRHLQTHKLDGAAAATDPVTGRQLLLANGDVRISYAVADAAVAAVPQRDR